MSYKSCAPMQEPNLGAIFARGVKLIFAQQEPKFAQPFHLTGRGEEAAKIGFSRKCYFTLELKSPCPKIGTSLNTFFFHFQTFYSYFAKIYRYRDHFQYGMGVCTQLYNLYQSLFKLITDSLSAFFLLSVKFVVDTN